MKNMKRTNMQHYKSENEHLKQVNSDMGNLTNDKSEKEQYKQGAIL